MLTRRILAMAALLLASLTIGGTSANAATLAAPTSHQTVNAVRSCGPHFCR
jgi:hypothetical protein